MRRRIPAGFTIVELLVVIAIIGVLVALLFPAIQMARESSRNSTCSNQLKQLALACLAHEQAQQHLPTGGWGYNWVGDPDQGFGLNQPGGWMFNILPYMDQQNLHDLGLGANPAGRATTLTTQLSGVLCPSRRGLSPPGAASGAPGYPFSPNKVGPTGGWWPASKGYFVNLGAAMPTFQQPIGRSDYAANGGSVCNTCLGSYAATGGSTGMYAGPPAPTPPNPPQWVNPTGPHFDTEVIVSGQAYPGYPGTVNGVMYLHSRVQMAQITDGASKTYLIGEKYLNPDSYYDGSGCGDCGGWNMGYDFNTTRWVSMYSLVSTPNQPVVPPARDTPGMDVSNAPRVIPNGTTPLTTAPAAFSYACDVNFGSPHTSTFNMALCDGSVHSIVFNVDIVTHIALGGRNDSLNVDAAKWNP